MNVHPSKLTGVVSPQGLAVLRALAKAPPRRQHPAGTLETRAIVRLLARNGRAQGVVKASLSRTIRRLWRQGLVELLDDDGATMSQAAARERPSFDRRLQDPRSAYQEHRKRCAIYGIDGYRSLEAFIAARCNEAHWKPVLRVTRVSLTEAGRRAQSPGCKLTGKGKR